MISHPPQNAKFTDMTSMATVPAFPAHRLGANNRELSPLIGTDPQRIDIGSQAMIEAV